MKTQDRQVGGFAEPNYTQVPNILLDVMMAGMDGSELKVVLAIVRKIIGYHKTAPEEISITQLEKMTGLSRRCVQDAVNRAIERGIVYKADGTGKRGTTRYGLKFAQSNDYGKNNHSENDYGKNNHSTMAESTIVEPATMANFAPTKEIQKEKEKKDSPKSAKQPSITYVLAQELAIICNGDFQLNKNKHIGSAKRLIEAGYALEDLIAFKEYWYSQDWRGQKGQTPTIANVNELIRLARDWKANKVIPMSPAKPQTPPAYRVFGFDLEDAG